MKKIILAIALFVALGLSANAQNDGFFSTGSNYKEYREDVWAQNMPVLPGQHGSQYDFAAESAPIGSGLLVLAGLGLAYAMRRKN